jgi:hypothetical protein
VPDSPQRQLIENRLSTASAAAVAAERVANRFSWSRLAWVVAAVGILAVTGH